jgi:hypothetical protein
MKKRPSYVSPWQWHKNQEPAAEGESIKRDKYGVRVYSLDAGKPGKKSPYFLEVAVNKSKKYKATSVRIVAGGKHRWYTFDLKGMEALRREFARGQQNHGIDTSAYPKNVRRFPFPRKKVVGKT